MFNDLAKAVQKYLYVAADPYHQEQVISMHIDDACVHDQNAVL